jgi:hypothetical protein
MIEHSQTKDRVEPPQPYVCTKQTVTEQFDSDGKVTERKVNVGETRSAANGNRDANKWTTSNGFSIDKELLSRYEFSILAKETVNGRPAYLLSFVPKQPPPPVHHFQDRLLNRAMGSIWIDDQDYDLVKANICLGQPVSFGILGAVDSFTFAFERARAEDGSWLTRWTETFIKARKFLKFVQTRRRVDWSDFKKANAASS